MKVYQMIYTSVRHSLADPELGLINSPGQRVYSCSQGLTRENIAELIRFSGYRLPKDDNTEHSSELGDPSVPAMFPKTFRTLRLSDGRFAAIQSVYSGVDINGEEGNFFAHALVFEGYSDEFFPERYFGSGLFRTYLTEQEQNTELVRYLPVIDDPPEPEGLDGEIKTFISLHKRELTYLINHAVTVLTSENLKNICISTDDEYLTERYLLALKWLLPRDVSRNTGISTYNVYLPSDKQDRLVFHGVIHGKNNITREAIDSRDSCVYLDFPSIDFSAVPESGLFKISVDELRAEYAKYNLQSVSAYLDWFSLTQNITFTGVGGKLLKFKHSAGDAAFVTRAAELFSMIDDESMSDVKFEIAKVMYDNIALFDDEVEKLTSVYVADCIEKLCMGEEYDIESVFSAENASQMQIRTMVEALDVYMDIIASSLDTMGEKNRFLLFNFIVHLKHAAEFESWADMMQGKRKHIAVLVELAVPAIVTGFGQNMIILPPEWEKRELDELVAYMEASTEDKQLSMSCIKYIIENTDVDWDKYGVTIARRRKMPDETASDNRKIRSWLTRVGYEPYQRNTYELIKRDVMAEVTDNTSPLLVARLLSAVYAWQGTYGHQNEAQRLAEKIRAMLIELRRTQPQCFNYMIPKLAMEILDTQGHYHELMINPDTMPQSFWNWFVIGAVQARRNDKRLLAYMRIYRANKYKLGKLKTADELRKIFKDE